MQYNGGSVVAMKGKNCVAIGCDRRLGVQALTVSCDFQKTFPVHRKLYYGLSGLATDIQTLYFETNVVRNCIDSNATCTS